MEVSRPILLIMFAIFVIVNTMIDKIQGAQDNSGFTKYNIGVPYE